MIVDIAQQNQQKYIITKVGHLLYLFSLLILS